MSLSLEWNGGRHVFAVGPDGRLRQRWEVAKAGGGKEWRSVVIGPPDLEPTQSPSHDEHNGQLHLYAVREDNRLFHAWQAKGGSSWGTENLD